MKLKNIILGLISASIAFPGCDEITSPIIPKQVNSTLPATKPNYIDSSATSGPYSYKNYKLLLEDCMGDQCPNCPTAAAIADTVISPTGSNPNYGQVVMMEENMGFDAQPNAHVAGVPSYAFTPNYTCFASNTWCTDFDLYTANYPVGMINRLGYSASSPGSVDILYTNNVWQDSVQWIIQHTQQSVEINIHDSCWVVPERIIGVEFQVSFINPLPAGAYSLVSVIIESPVISWQEMPGSQKPDSVYHHTNVLRGAFGNNTGGLPSGITIPTTTVGSNWTSYQTYDFTNGENGNAAGWNMANCSIVAFVYNQTTFQVVQAEMIKVE